MCTWAKQCIWSPLYNILFNDLHFDPKCVTSGGPLYCFSFAPLIWSWGPNSRLLAVRAHTIIHDNSPNWLTPVLWKSAELYISRLRWKSFSVTAMEKMPHSLLPISFSKLWKISVFCTTECREEGWQCLELAVVPRRHLNISIHICSIWYINAVFVIVFSKEW